MRRCGRLLVSGLLLLAAACASAPPPAAVDVVPGRVRARDLALAERAAAILSELEPKVAGIVPNASRHPLEVWVEREISPPRGGRAKGVAAYTVTHIRTDTGERSSVIHLPEAAIDDRSVFAHELTHARLGADWDPLPDLVVEGICEYVASVLDPEFARDSAPRHLALAAIAAGSRVEVGSGPGAPGGRTSRIRAHFTREWRVTDFLGTNLGRTGEPRDWERERVAYAFGYLLVASAAERGGLGSLRDLARDAARAGRGPVPAADLLAAAGIDDESNLPAWVERRLNASALEHLARMIAPAIADILLDDHEAATAGETPEAFLARGAPRLSAGGASVPLRPIPEVLAALRSAWPSR